MPIAVPRRQTIAQQRSQGQPLPEPPPAMYALMAATQMASEGRLAQPTGGIEDKLNSIPDADKGPYKP